MMDPGQAYIAFGVSNTRTREGSVVAEIAELPVLWLPLLAK